jgi:hypothetical protein
MDNEYPYYYPERGSHTDREPLLRAAEILGDAYLECAISGLRFGLGATKTVIKGQIRLVKNLSSLRDSSASAESAIYSIVDDARTCLREIGDSASYEFRRLQSRLSTLQEAAREIGANRSEQDDVYGRHWKAKL